MPNPISVYQKANDAGVLVAQDLLVMAAPWVPGVTMPAPAFTATGLVPSVITSLGLKTIGRIDQKAGLKLTPDAKYNEIMGYGARTFRRRILQEEGLTIDLTPQEVRKITLQIQKNMLASNFVSTPTGGWRSKKTAGMPSLYWSLFIHGLDYNEATGNPIFPWWFIPKVGTDKGAAINLTQDSPLMPGQSLAMIQDGDNLYEDGMDGGGWAEIAPSLGFTFPWLVTISGNPTAGTFILTIGGQPTAAIQYNATATAVKSAIEALSNVGAGNVTVTGNAGGPYTITIADSVVPQTLTASGSFTGGTSPAITAAAAA